MLTGLVPWIASAIDLTTINRFLIWCVFFVIPTTVAHLGSVAGVVTAIHRNNAQATSGVVSVWMGDLLNTSCAVEVLGEEIGSTK